MIPKILHYVWVGSDIPERVQSLINHNKTHTSDYHIKVWTEHNLPKLNKFAKNAYVKKNWAFVSDYVRFVALRQYGGIYLDTDQKLLKNIDDLLSLAFFAGWNKAETYIYTGIIGCVPESDFVNRILEEYDNIEFDIKQSSPKVLTRCFKEQAIDVRFKVFDSSYFYPVQAGEKDNGRIFPHTYATHLWDESWVSFVRLRRFLRWIGLIRVYHLLRKHLNV
jgi:mannosyltransferase OCH1-like enzyme